MPFPPPTNSNTNELASVFQLCAGGARDPLVQTIFTDDEQDVESHVPGETELGRAARLGNVEEVDRLLASGVDPNDRDAWGQTALFQALSQNNPVVVASLMLARADPTRASDAGLSAFDMVRNPLAEALLGALAPVTSKKAPNAHQLHKAVAFLRPEQRKQLEEMSNSPNRLLAV
jgi:ankyrin repeat protein